MLKRREEIVTEETPELRDEFEELLMDALADLRPLQRAPRKIRSRQSGRESTDRQAARLAAAS